jgi:hypothetical protein
MQFNQFFFPAISLACFRTNESEDLWKIPSLGLAHSGPPAGSGQRACDEASVASMPFDYRDVVNSIGALTSRVLLNISTSERPNSPDRMFVVLRRSKRRPATH